MRSYHPWAIHTLKWPAHLLEGAAVTAGGGSLHPSLNGVMPRVECLLLD